MNYVLRRKGVGEKIGSISEYSETGLTVIRSDHTLPEEPDFVFRWGSTGTVPRKNSTVFVNEASSIHKVYDKRSFRKEMADAGLAPKTWIDFGDFIEEHCTTYDTNGTTRLIVRPEHHIRSLDLNVCSGLNSVYHACQKYEKYYISEFIPKDKEWRVFVVQGRVAAVVEKIPVDPDEVSWGCVDQGQFRYVNWNEWPLTVTRTAVQAFQLSGLDFGAVDVISISASQYGPEKVYVLEINTAPELTPYYIKTMTKCFDYIVKNGKEIIPITETTWRGMIHPAVSTEARTI